MNQSLPYAVLTNGIGVTIMTFADSEEFMQHQQALAEAMQKNPALYNKLSFDNDLAIVLKGNQLVSGDMI